MDPPGPTSEYSDYGLTGDSVDPYGFAGYSTAYSTPAPGTDGQPQAPGHERDDDGDDGDYGDGDANSAPDGSADETDPFLSRLQSAFTGPGRTRDRAYEGSAEAEAEAEAQLARLNRLAAESGGGASWRRGGPSYKGVFSRRTRRVDAGHAFKVRQTAATAALLDGRLRDALRHAREAVKQNPEIYAAHSLLAEILHALERPAEAVAVLLSGAHSSRDPIVWWHVAEAVARSEDESEDARARELRLNGLLYCYANLCRLTDEVEPRMEKIRVLAELGRKGRSVVRDCEVLMRVQPLNVEALTIMTDAALGATGPKALRALQWRELADKWDEVIRRLTGMTFTDDGVDWVDPDTELEVADEGELGWESLEVFLELLIGLGEPRRGILAARAMARWLVGREAEMYWDDYPDDREWDLEDNRRLEVPEYSEAEPEPTPELFGGTLSAGTRLRLGEMRIVTDQYEGVYHFNQLLAYAEYVAPSEFSVLVRRAAESLLSHSLFAHARPFLEQMLVLSGPGETVEDESDFWRALAAAYRAEDRLLEAEECLVRNVAVAEGGADERVLMGARIHLFEFYQQLGQTEKARQLLESSAAMLSSFVKNAASTIPTAGAVPRFAAGRERGRYRHRRRLLHGDPIAPRALVDQLWLGLDEAEADGDVSVWLSRASALLATFRACPYFWPSRDKCVRFSGYSLAHLAAQGKIRSVVEVGLTAERYGIVSAPELHRDFYGVEFGRWADLFCRYALVSVSRADSAEAAEQPSASASALTSSSTSPFASPRSVLEKRRSSAAAVAAALLETAVAANVFYHTPEIARQLRLALLMLAFRADDSAAACAHSRWLVKVYPHTPDVYRLMSALHRAMPLPVTQTTYSAGPTQKFVLRLVKMMDYFLLSGPDRAAVGKKYTADERARWNQLAVASQQQLQQQTGGDVVPVDPSLTGPAELAEPVAVPALPVVSGSGVSAAVFPRRHNPALLTLYGHMLAAGRQTGALNYYYRALALRPTDPVLNLSMAAVYLQNAIKRRADNRHLEILLAIAFLTRYATFRLIERADPAVVRALSGVDSGEAAGPGGVGGGEELLEQVARLERPETAATPAALRPLNSTAFRDRRAEVEYNSGRFWHTLGILHLAVPRYWACLAGPGEEDEEEQKEEPTAGLADRMEGVELEDGGGCGDGKKEQRRKQRQKQSPCVSEAAYSLRLIYAQAGNGRAARRVVRRWMVI